MVDLAFRKPVVLEVGNGRPVELADLKEAKAFADGERHAWRDLERYRHEGKWEHQIISQQMRPAEEIDDVVTNVLGRFSRGEKISEEEIEDVRRSVESSLDEYKQGKASLGRPDNPTLYWLGEDPPKGLNMLAQSIGEEVSPGSPLRRKPKSMLGELREKAANAVGEIVATQAETSRLLEKIHGVSENAGELRKDTRNTQATAAQMLDSIKNMAADVEQLREGLSAATKKSKKEFDAKVDALQGEHEEGLRRIEQSFIEDLRLRSPRKSWNRKAIRHGVLAGVSFAAFVVAGAAALYLFIEFGIPRVEAAYDTASTTSTVAVLMQRLLLFVELGIPAAAAIWLLRIFSRITFGELALVNDAQERVAMSETLITLVAETETNDAQRTVAYRSLFRPATVGHIDDASPYRAADRIVDGVAKQAD